MRVPAARSFSYLFPLALLAGSPPLVAAQEDVLVDVRDLSPREHRMQRFELSREQAVWIRAVGAEPRGRSFLSRFLDRGIFMGREPKWDGDAWPANAWIIDARTSRLVWELRTARPVTGRKGVHAFEGTVMLPAGTYEAHYAALYPVAGFTGDGNDWRVARREAPTGGPYVEGGAYREFGVLIRGAGRSLSPAGTVARPGDVAVLIGAGADARERVGLALEATGTLVLYGVGERAGSEWRDYGWIADATTGRQLWSFDDAPSEHAGGAAINQMVSARVTLPAGRYVASYVTDGSHHPDGWGQAPPYDAGTWGLTVRVAPGGDQTVARAFPYEPVPGDAAVRLAGLGNDTLAVQAFAVRQPVTVRVAALGEGRGGSLYDYGWIVDAAGRAVWRMDYGATHGAGGSDKNRALEGEIRLEPGTYTAYFRTDGSHSFGDGFNTSRPFDGDLWGMTLWSEEAALQLVAADRGEQALAQLVRIGDDGDERAAFRLAAETAVRVLAIGEGDGEMYDYGWIENAAGTVVWRMEFDGTEHAGGASKNRRADEVIRLPAGGYTLRYRSDGSHAFGDWNGDPPDDPLGWGVRVMLAERR